MLSKEQQNQYKYCKSSNGNLITYTMFVNFGGKYYGLPQSEILLFREGILCSFKRGKAFYFQYLLRYMYKHFFYLQKENCVFFGSVRKELSRIPYSTIKILYSKWNTREREMLITT